MRITRSKAIRLRCLDCCCNNSKEVALCSAKNCSLWNYRFGYEVDDEGNRIARRKPPKNTFQNGEFEVESCGEDEDDFDED